MQIDHQFVASVRWSNRQFARIDDEHSTLIHFQKCYSTFQELFSGPLLNTWKNRRGSEHIIFLDIACAPGGFSQFLLDHFPTCLGFGITLPSQQGGFPVQVCDHRFHLSYFDLLSHPTEPTPATKMSADIVIGDAQYFPRTADSKYGGKMAGTVTGGRLGLLLREFILGFEALAPGGVFIFRFVAWDRVHANILKLFFLCFHLFQQVVPFKSEYQHTADCTFYAVCLGFDRQKYEDLDIDTVLKVAFARVVLSPPFAAVHNGTVNCIQVIKTDGNPQGTDLVLDKPDAHILEKLFPFKTLTKHEYFEPTCDIFAYVYKMFLIGKSCYTDHHPQTKLI